MVVLFIIIAIIITTFVVVEYISQYMARKKCNLCGSKLKGIYCHICGKENRYIDYPF